MVLLYEGASDASFDPGPRGPFASRGKPRCSARHEDPDPGTPDRPAEKPPQAPGIHDVRLYNRYKLSRFSLESSPMLSYMQTTGFVAEGEPRLLPVTLARGGIRR